jgi:hypothetical protein
MFPKQMFLGFYYAELQEDGYIDDYCCYTTNGEQLEKDEIPARTGMVDAEYIAREEKLEQAFFLFRRAAVEFTEKPCNGVTLILMNNGQAKLDIVSKDLIEGEEDERYATMDAYKKGRVIFCNFAKTPYRELAGVQPQLLLADFVKAFHPELLPHYHAKYYQLIQ